MVGTLEMYSNKLRTKGKCDLFILIVILSNEYKKNSVNILAQAQLRII